MYQDFDIDAFFKRNKKQILGSILLFWLIFGVLMVVENEIALHISGQPVDPLDRLQYSIRWVLWTLLTPIVIYLAIKFPIRKRYLLTDIAKHLFFAVLIITLEFWLEIPIIRYATLKITGTVDPVLDYGVYFILKLNIYLLLYFVVVGTTFVVLYIESNYLAKTLAQEADIKNQQLQTQLAEAKLSLLKIQLDPHFLFNTHHAIVGLMLNDENDKAIRMLTKLSDLLRLSLEEPQQTVLLEREMQLLKLYLDIQQIRFQDRLKISFGIEPESLSQNVPSFILQPLVENALKHGIALSSRTGKIRIESAVSANQLILSVENNGMPIDFPNFREGIGITNTKERLHQLYNSRSKFELNNLPGGGVIASITIPLN